MKRFCGLLTIVMAGLALLFASGAQAGATITVATTTDDGANATASNCTSHTGSPCTLRDAILDANANPGSAIVLPAGQYALSDGQLTIATPVPSTGQGAAPGDTQISQKANSGDRVLEIAPTVSAGQITI